jgi:hypothetical protein
MVALVVVVARPIRFDDDDPRPMLRHLDSWARRTLTSPERWGSILERCGQWVDYSARNQVLLASYGIAGLVAGAATWERVPSTETGRGCAVRAGEHGLPVRVPVLDDRRVDSERSRSGAASESVARTHRWEPVFALEQLARRPAWGALKPSPVPSLSEAEWVEAVRVTTGRVLGRMPRRVDDPVVQLGMLSGRVSNGGGRFRLRDVLAAQAGWLVAERVGLEAGPLPAFDPGGLAVRERWRTLVDVRHAAGVVTDGLSHALGVDLAVSPLPRHELVDDRLVPPGRRNYLAPADLRALPMGVWVEVGPYTPGEWLGRGVAGAVGVAAFCRVTDRSYVAAYETRGGAMWRLETTGGAVRAGLVAEGVADGLAAARDDARRALSNRFPERGNPIVAASRTRVVSPDLDWAPLPGGRDERTQRRVLDQRVAALVAPGPGGRWETWVSVDGELRQGPLASDPTTGRETADLLARRALAGLVTLAPDAIDALLADFATHPQLWDRGALVDAIGSRLSHSDRLQLAETTDPTVLVEAMAAAGVVAPATMLAVLHAEGIAAEAATALVPATGIGVADAIRILHAEWGADRLEIGAQLNATVEELREAGCGPTELLAAAPRETLRSFDERESTWTRVGPTLLEAGYAAAEAVAQVAAHAPTPETFAAAVSVIVEDVVSALAYAACRAEPERLAALTERYGLAPDQAAAAFAAAGVPVDRAIEAVHLRCDHDVETTYELATGVLGAHGDLVTAVLTGDVSTVVALPTLDVVDDLICADTAAVEP